VGLGEDNGMYTEKGVVKFGVPLTIVVFAVTVLDMCLVVLDRLVVGCSGG